MRRFFTHSQKPVTEPSFESVDALQSPHAMFSLRASKYYFSIRAKVSQVLSSGSPAEMLRTSLSDLLHAARLAYLILM
jgi:hypothetical protein